MRIGVMLRHFDQHPGGVRVYTQQLIQTLLARPSGHEFVLFYRNPALVGTHAGVTEVALGAYTTLGWDQWAVRRAIRHFGINVLFNPKYSIPIRPGCPAVWVCHGLDWYVMPRASLWTDRLSHRYLVPQYARDAAAVIAVSEITRQHVMQYLGVPAEHVHRVYSGVDPRFAEPVARAQAELIRSRLQLPERYVLYVGAIYPPKNFRRLVQAYARIGPVRGVSLVIAGGENRFLSESELDEPQRLGLGRWVRQLGWVEHRELPVLYALAEALFMPSLFEACPLPIIEAMATSCPIVTSDRFGSAELAGDAAIQVDPENVETIADGLARLLDDSRLRADLIARGRSRAANFSWQRCADQTLAVITSAANPDR